MAYADDTATLVKWVKVWEEELKNAISATENTQTNMAALTADIDSLSEAGKAAVTAQAIARRATQAGMAGQARAQLMPILAQIARTIASETVQGDTINDLTQFFRDWRYYQDNTADEKVTARSVTFASEPAASVTGNFWRLTVGVNGAGDKIESGRHATTQTLKCNSKPGPYQATFNFQGTAGALDRLAYTSAPAPRTNGLTLIGSVTTGSSVNNPNMTGNTDTSDNAAVTAMTGWTLATTAGSPSLLIEKTSAKLWQGRSYVFSISGASTTKTFTQSIPAGVLTDRYKAYLPVAPFNLTTGWAGTITITWGSKSQGFTEANLTNNDWVVLAVDRDADLYVQNFDQTVPTWALSIAAGAGAGSNELAFAGMWAIEATLYNDLRYFAFGDDDEPTEGATVAFADTQTAAGEIQDTIDFALQDEGVGAYLMTTGTNTLADPA